MQGRGTIYIRTCCNLAQQRVQVEIRGTGPGIPDQFRGKIFEPYFSTKQHGTGLGLSLVCRILTDHCGFIKVVKHWHAAGATFLIELPIT
jgi:two-component system, NtrC family, nitrogen regulation sensor histidine kinase NtrY